MKRTFETGVWYSLSEVDEMPTKEEFGEGRFMVQKLPNGIFQAWTIVQGFGKFYAAEVSGFCFFDLPPVEPFPCPICGQKPDHDAILNSFCYWVGCTRPGHQIWVQGKDRVEAVGKWNELPR